MKYCYKVVKDARGRYAGKRYKSCIVPSENRACLTYVLNKVTKPKVGRIFVFKYLWDANDFATSSEIILKCKYTGTLQPLERRLHGFVKHFSEIKSFWKDISSSSSSSTTTPEGTYTAASVTPVAIVK